MTHHRFWFWLVCAVAIIVLLPITNLIISWSNFQTDIWLHLIETQLGQLLSNTFWLIFGVSIGVTVLGVGLAWLTAMCEFPGRKWLDWALMLPFAVPAYVMAFVFLGIFEFSGPIQTQLREWFGPGNYFPAIRSTGGVITVLSLVFYPYVYMLARSAFISQGRGLMDAARILGLTPWQAFFKVTLPMARPAIAAGLALALMETLADFGAVATFNYDTFTTAIYKAWYGFFNLQAAAQLATLLLLFVALAVFIEKNARGRARYNQDSQHLFHRYQLTGLLGIAASLFACLVVLVAFIMPITQLIIWVIKTGLTDFDSRFLSLVGHSLSLGAIAAVTTVTIALLLAIAQKQPNQRWLPKMINISTLGYALPGSVLAVGIMMGFSWVDNHIFAAWFSWMGEEPRQVLLGSLLALIVAYGIRFLAVAFGPVDSSLYNIKPSITEAARSLGANSKRIILHIYLPMMTPGVLTGALLVFVDVLKEMPATLLMRPFGWDTLAVRVYEMTSEGEWARAALPALTLVIVGLLPVILLMRRSNKY
ncbi:iron ABC transporter permease [Endozoicomonas sp. SM1973]|uniref:Iron ABC transporter permease n=1 Tax=Spartinivicinus marinus TaxID=2994442 RepID=A0A853I3R4_9GAMM|nr:iron ABC transporter permease [Spartinivicinus marinus]MCX4027146.1 iron ABC transporter permease [Spartinivicinus marinus]NYZ66132.1 iron ABC transporter permease [Spartinivicinus marinus]